MSKNRKIPRMGLKPTVAGLEVIGLENFGPHENFRPYCLINFRGAMGVILKSTLVSFWPKTRKLRIFEKFEGQNP